MLALLATDSESISNATVNSSIADGSTIAVQGLVQVLANGSSSQHAHGTGVSAGIVALGGNASVANSGGQTNAFVGNNVNINGGTAVGGLTDGAVYYAVPDDYRPFSQSQVGFGTNVIYIGNDNGLQNGDPAVYNAPPGGSPIGGLVSGQTYSVQVLPSTPAYIQLHYPTVIPMPEPALLTQSSPLSEMNFGTDTGLQNYDEVIYHVGAGGTAVGGLTDGATYQVLLDVNRPGFFVLLNPSLGTQAILNGKVASGANQYFTVLNPRVVSLDPTRGSPYGHYLQLLAPRRVRLAATYQDAVASIPNTLSLSQPTIDAGGHELVPLGTQGGTIGLLFDPAVAVDGTLNTINIGPGNGLYAGQAVVYHHGMGPALTIAATGTDTDYASSTAGSGGLVAGAAAVATTSPGGSTHAFIADGTAADHTTLDLSSLAITANQADTFDGKTDSIQADAVGFSGSWATNNVTANSDANVGAYVQVNTQNVNINAENDEYKNIVNGDNVLAGSGGVLQGNAAQSFTTISNHAEATINNNASVTVSGDPTHPGQFLLNSYNDIEGEDGVNLNTGGVIVGSGVTSHIDVARDEAFSTIANHATVTTIGDLDLQSLARGILAVSPTVHTFGLASAGVVDAAIDLNANNQVGIGNGATVIADGNVNLLAGKDTAGQRNVFQLDSHGDELNGSPIPISSLHSDVNLQQTNDVNIGPGAVVNTGGNATLDAEQLSTADITSYGEGKDWLSAVAGVINEIFGSSGVSATLHGGTAEDNTDTAVVVNGNINTGINRDQIVTLDKGTDPSNENEILITEPTPAGFVPITFTMSIESVASNLATQRSHLLYLIEEYSGDDTAVAAYSAELTNIQQQMAALGLATTEFDGTTLYNDQYSSPYVTIAPIQASSGSIYLNGSTIAGSGALECAGRRVGQDRE